MKEGDKVVVNGVVGTVFKIVNGVPYIQLPLPVGAPATRPLVTGFIGETSTEEGNEPGHTKGE